MRRLHDPVSLRDLPARYPNRQGAATVRAGVAASEAGTDVTREGLEEDFREFLVRRGFPLPEFDRWIQVGRHWYEADCVWHDQRLMVELDGGAVHGTRRNYESDRLRDRRIHAAGWRPTRVTWRQVHEEPDDLAADLRTLLAA